MHVSLNVFRKTHSNYETSSLRLQGEKHFSFMCVVNARNARLLVLLTMTEKHRARQGKDPTHLTKLWALNPL